MNIDLDVSEENGIIKFGDIKIVCAELEAIKLIYPDNPVLHATGALKKINQDSFDREKALYASLYEERPLSEKMLDKRRRRAESSLETLSLKCLVKPLKKFIVISDDKKLSEHLYFLSKKLPSVLFKKIESLLERYSSKIDHPSFCGMLLPFPDGRSLNCTLTRSQNRVHRRKFKEREFQEQLFKQTAAFVAKEREIQIQLFEQIATFGNIDISCNTPATMEAQELVAPTLPLDSCNTASSIKLY